LAGSATAYALAQRGGEVTVLEAQHEGERSNPSASLPVALMAEHQSAHDIPISQISRLGLAATTAFAQKHLVPGQDWLTCGALLRAGRLSAQPQWQAHATWIKPAALVQAWLAHPRITLRQDALVQRLRLSSPGRWQALDAQGALWAEADALVLANANPVQALLGAVLDAHDVPISLPALSLSPVMGQVLYGPWDATWQAAWPHLCPEELALLHAASLPPSSSKPSSAPLYCAINGNGHFLPAVPWQGSSIWLSGSTYEHDCPIPSVTEPGLQANLQRLSQLIPAAVPLLSKQHRAGVLRGWAGMRCTTHDRLPVVGAVSVAQTPGLYLCTAMGSRGASFASVCAEHIAALIFNSHDSPLNEALAQAIAMRRIS
jgi:tRNA 5-methylaminomethyl-2-thiouridine biosynthesis bifunctional protein